jgi:methyl-accepting chemotaxis protein
MAMFKLKDITIGSKIMGMVGILLLLTAICAGYGILKLGHVGEEIKEIAEQDIPLTEAITEITINQLEQAIWFERALRFGEVLAAKDASVEGLKHAKTEFDDHTNKVNTIVKDAQKIAHGAMESASNQETRQQFEKINTQLVAIDKHHKAFEEHAHQAFTLIEKGDLHAAEALAEKVEAEEEKLDHELEAFLKYVETFTHESALKAERDEHSAFTGMVIMTVTSLIVGLAMGFLLTLAITRPIKKGVVFANAMADGDLTQTLDVDQRDEIGVLAMALNQMAVNLRAMFKKTADGVSTLTASSTELSAISEQMAAGAEQTSGKSNQVAAAAEEMSANMNSVAAASEQASTNVQMVAAASEQMSATINEIAGNTEKGRMITGNAVNQAKNVSTRVAELGKAAVDVGKVTETINDISEQTNLLALNATIEAARAGEAGKEFAVVANEIKELAKQTAVATQDIRLKIEGIQSSTEGTVTEISQIEKVIADINEIVSTIATAVEEQSVSTKEIASNVNQAAQGIQDVNENVAQSSTVSASIAKDVVEVNQAAKEMADGTLQINSTAEELSKLAEELKAMVDQYKV